MDKIAKSVIGENINFLGEVTLTVTLNGVTKKLKVYVLKKFGQLVRNRLDKKIQSMGLPNEYLLSKNRKYNVQFDKSQKGTQTMISPGFSCGLGKCFELKAKLKVKDGEQPVFKKKRIVSFTAREQINKELDRLEQAGILSKTDFSEWASPMVHVKKKSNQIRICADFSTELNYALQDHHYPHPSPVEIFYKLNGGKIFSKIDLSDAYLHLEVDKESSKLLCINTHKELYKYNKLAFGVKVAPAIFQQVMDTMLGDLDYATSYSDDILVTSKTTTEHRNHIINVFEE